jgi:hypothetical protein
VQHLDELNSYIARLDQTLEDALEELPRKAQEKRSMHSAADLREVTSAYAHWLLYRPRAADLFFSRRRFMLHGMFPEEHRELAIALAKRTGRVFHRCVERLAIEAVLEGKAKEDALRTPQAENALEHITENVMENVHGFYLTVVQGSLGTGAAFRAAFQYRRDNRDLRPDFAAQHETLITSYDQAVAQANRALEDDVRIPYGKLKAVYDAQFAAARPAMFGVWETSYAPLVVQKTLSMLVTELHRVGVLSDKAFLGAMKELFTSARGKDVLLSRHAERRYARLDPR